MSELERALGERVLDIAWTSSVELCWSSETD